MDSRDLRTLYGREAEAHAADRVARLGRATLLLSRELAGCRREIHQLKRENAELRQLASHPSG